MRKLSVIEMEHLQGGREADCAINAAFTVVGTAVGILAISTVTGGFALAATGFAIGYLRNMYSTAKACNLI